MSYKVDTAALHDWFEENRRSFPWREKQTPYRVWISEVMLQQTRASVVIPYFERWMRLFPDVRALAKAPLEEVIKAWEGLGYYNRARRLHEGAKQIVAKFSGEIPRERDQLATIKGLGPYTINAILSFAYHKRCAAVDGNVARVMARYALIEEDISRQKIKIRLQEAAEGLLDEKKPWVTAEALIELGAMLCLPKPFCDLCPLQTSCLALKHNKVSELPLKIKEEAPTLLHRSVVVIESESMLLLNKGKPGRVMADLYEFPYFEGLEQPLKNYLRTHFGLETSFIRSLPLVQHRFTRYLAHLFPVHLRADERKQIDEMEWVHIDRLIELPFSAGHRRILEHFLKLANLQMNLF